ncbi:hypothetical protein [Thorsellia anophelis]|uniref:Uncharacterized protein n=1 Tax=Thorsellia anophelis DSM 18579 TaxID=1123402 RepID=A0A1I0C7T6_9GAMM|nr:hypothetical protein [Thorsellia anophelis]SET15526.1 hypothetical protein SAMN02583745_01506 [Thorsellia anophelis DSM 18579]
MPNRFWKDTPQIPTAPKGIGNTIQQNTAANNPDIFCESQGKGYRLPSVHEYETDAINTTNPGYPRSPQSPGHWSAYINNDVKDTRKTNIATRSVSGAISNEWGDLTKYNGWNDTAGLTPNYWTTETSHYQGYNYGNNIWDIGYGRIYFNVQSMIGYGTRGTRYNLYTNPFDIPTPNATDLGLVACIRDLVPTPATPVPGKS